MRTSGLGALVPLSPIVPHLPPLVVQRGRAPPATAADADKMAEMSAQVLCCSNTHVHTRTVTNARALRVGVYKFLQFGFNAPPWQSSL